MNPEEPQYTPIDEKVHQRILNDWLPNLDRILERRKITKRLMVVVILVPILLTVFAFVYMAMTGSFDAIGALSTTPLQAFTAIGFVYLGKLQACDDKIFAVRCKVQLGHLEPLLEGLKEISCYGQFNGLFKDMKEMFQQNN